MADNEIEKRPEGETPTTASHEPTSGGAAGGGGALPPSVLRRKLARRRKAAAAGGDARREAAQRGLEGDPKKLPHQGKMEAGFAEGLGGVRAHTGPAAREAAEALGTEAFAVGQDVAFRDENPSEKVVAHEVAHTLQQRNGGGGEVHTFGGSHGDPLEREADLAAQAVTRGGRATVRGAADGAPVQGFESLSEIKTQCADAAEILWELGRLAEFHLFSGTFEGDLDIGKAAYYCKLIHSGGVLGMLELDSAARGSNIVHLKLNLYHQTFEVSAATLKLNGFNSPSFTSRACVLGGVMIRGTLASADVTVAGATLQDATFIKGKDRVAAAEVGLSALHLDGNYGKSAGGEKSVVGGMSFGEVHIHGLRYPDLPPTDVAVKQAGLTFDLLWTTLGPKAPAAGGGALPEGPEVLPKDSRLQIEFDGLKGSGTDNEGVKAGAGGFDHFQVQLLGADGGELAAITVDGFHAAAGNAGGSGTIDRLTVKGEPSLVKGLLANDQVKAQPAVRQALDVIRSCGVEPAVGGVVTLEHVGVSAGQDGKATAKGNLAAHVAVPDLGALELSLSGFVANVDQGALSGGFDRFTARLVDPNGKELGYVELDGGAGTEAKGGKSGTGGVKKFVARGDLGGLVKAARGTLEKLPPQVRVALDSVRQLGVKGEVAGDLQGSAGDGTAKVAGDLDLKLDAGAAGTATLALKGFHADGKHGAAGASFTRLEARLLGKNQEAAFLAIDAADGNRADKSVGFEAKKVEARGDAANLAALLGAIEKQAAGLPPTVKRACDVVRASSLVGGGDLTLANVQAGGDGKGGETARADVAAKVEVPRVGELDVTIAGFQSHAQKGGDKEVAFDRLEVTLRNKAGAVAAFFAADAQAKEGADAKSASLRAKKIEARGDRADLDALFTAVAANVRQLPPQMKAAFATVREFGVDGKGDVSLANVEVSGDKDGTRAKADLGAGFDMGDAGKVSVVVHGFAGDVTATGKQVQFDSFEATLCDGKGAQVAHLLVEGSKDRVTAAGTDKPDVSFHAKTVQAQGSAKDLASLLAGVEQRLRGLPPQVARAFDVVKKYGTELPATADVSLSDVDLGSRGGQVSVQGDLSARVEIPDVGTLEARLLGSRAGDRPGFDSLDVKLTDQGGGEAATLHVGGVTLGADGKSAAIGSIQAHGDGTRLHALLDPKVQALLPPELVKSLALLDGNRLGAALDGLSVKQDGNGAVEAGADSIVLTAALNFVDAQGTVYRCPDAALTLTGAKVQLGPDRKPRRIDAAAMTARGHFTGQGKRGASEGTATLRTGAVKVVMGPGGAPLSVVASDIQASGDIQSSQAPAEPTPQTNPEPKADGIKKLEPVAESAARLVRSADIHTHTPLFPGRYGRSNGIGVAEGSTLNVDLVARGGALAAGTDVTFAPPLDLPLWLSLKGVNLEVKGTEGVLNTDLKGFFDFNLSKYVSGQKTVSLDIATLVRQVMDHLQQTIAEAKPRSEKDVASDQKWLDGEHGHWAADARKHADKAARKGAAEQKKVAAEDAAEEPRSASAADLASPKGMNILGTTGTADLELASPKQDATVEGVTMPAGGDVHLHGQSEGGGRIALTADEVAIQAGGNKVDAKGLATGEVHATEGDGGTRVQFDSFSLKELRWEALGRG